MKKRTKILIVILIISVFFNFFQLFQMIRFDYSLKECERLLLSQVRESKEKEKDKNIKIEHLEKQLEKKDSVIYNIISGNN